MVQPVPVDSMDTVDTADTLDTVDSVASVDSVDLSACWQNCMDVLQPQTIAPVQVGSQIVTRNTDVEVMVVLLKDLPLTPAAFKDLAKDADWYRFSFMHTDPQFVDKNGASIGIFRLRCLYGQVKAFFGW